jgi:hypothetical protein
MKRSDVTYGQLDKALRSLGFSCRLSTDDSPSTRVYQHKEAGALIMLPAFPESDPVFEHHLLDVRVQLDNFGIANSSVFDAKLRKAG